MLTGFKQTTDLKQGQAPLTEAEYDNCSTCMQNLSRSCDSKPHHTSSATCF